VVLKDRFDRIAIALIMHIILPKSLKKSALNHSPRARTKNFPKIALEIKKIKTSDLEEMELSIDLWIKS